MGRPEHALDAHGGALAQLAQALRELRAEAGLTYREMARLSGRGASTLSKAAAGDALPAWPVVAAYVRGCGGDLREWEERWRAVADEQDRQVVPRGRGRGTVSGTSPVRTGGSGPVLRA